MLVIRADRSVLARGCFGSICWLLWAAIGVAAAEVAPPPVGGPPLTLPSPPAGGGGRGRGPSVLSLAEAVRWALQYNPELTALRQQHGVAAAGVVIARTYPFNPVWEGKVRGTTGPQAAGITNPVSNEHKILLEVEIRGQGRHRRQAALAALSRPA